jgi:hypothetical protein
VFTEQEQYEFSKLTEDIIDRLVFFATKYRIDRDSVCCHFSDYFSDLCETSTFYGIEKEGEDAKKN